MPYDFDRVIDRRGTGSIKWELYGPDVLPMWVADMDWQSPEPILRALHERVAHGVFGYGGSSPDLKDVICERMDRLYDWSVTPDQVVFLPGVVSGFNVACRSIDTPGAGVLVQTPCYPPFLTAPGNNGLVLQTVQLPAVVNGHTLRYETDDAAMEAAITPETRLFLFCNPHNPTGREFTRDEMARMADIALRHDLLICSDEIHCELMLDGHTHAPIATLSPEIADRCVTLMAPSKTFNIAGLGSSLAIISNKELRQRFERAGAGLVPHASVLGLTAALAAYREGDPWLVELLAYLTVNRNVLADYCCASLPGVRTTVPEATYLGWLDFRAIELETSPFEFCLRQAKVAFNDGATFGPGGAGFVRINFGCPRSQMLQALEQVREALAGRSSGR